MRRFAVGADAIDCDFHAVARGRDDDPTVLPGPRAQFGLSIVQLPGAYVHVSGEAHRNGSEQRWQSQQHLPDFHVISFTDFFLDFETGLFGLNILTCALYACIASGATNLPLERIALYHGASEHYPPPTAAKSSGSIADKPFPIRPIPLEVNRLSVISVTNGKDVTYSEAPSAGVRRGSSTER
jgi:hypothetical protein